MRAICIIASDNVKINGDVVFVNKNKCKPCYFFDLKDKANVLIANTLVSNIKPKKGFKLKMLWFWHMVILRKPYVYLTGVCR